MKIGEEIYIHGFVDKIHKDGVVIIRNDGGYFGTVESEVVEDLPTLDAPRFIPIRIDGVTEKCPNCGEKVMYAVGTGTMFHGSSESYEDWRVIKHDYCPKCGAKMKRTE